VRGRAGDQPSLTLEERRQRFWARERRGRERRGEQRDKGRLRALEMEGDLVVAVGRGSDRASNLRLLATPPSGPECLWRSSDFFDVEEVGL
jgi:hypothetical protein